MPGSNFTLSIQTTADPSGIDALLRGLADAQKNIGQSKTQWQSFRDELGKKFSLPEMGKDLLAKVGLDSALHVAEKVADLLVQPYKDAAESATIIANESERTLAAVERTIRLHQTDRQALQKLRNDQARDKRDFDDLNTPKTRTYAYGGTARGFEVRRMITEAVPLTDAQQERKAELATILATRGIDISTLEAKIKAEDDKADDDARQSRINALTAKLHEQEQAFDSLVGAQDKASEAWNDETQRAQQYLAIVDPLLPIMTKIAEIKALSEKRPDLISPDRFERIRTKLLADANGSDPKQSAAPDKPDPTPPPETLRERDQKALDAFTDPSKHYQSPGAGMLGGLQQQLASLGTTGDRVAKTIQTSIGGAFDAVSKNLTGLIMGTESWHDALRNIYNTIATDLVQGIVKMFTEWVEQRAIAGVASMLWSAREGAADTEAKTPGAVLGSISSFGVAAVVGVAAIVAAMAAFGGFAEGGFTSPGPLDRPAGVVHAGEWVAPQWQVAHPVYGPMIATLEAARRGSPGFSGGGFFNEWSGVGGAVGAFTKAFLPTYKTNPWQAFLNVLDYGEHPPGGDRLINSLMLGQAVPNDDSTSAWSWDASTQSWIKSTANVAGAMTTPYQSDASDGTAGATGVAGSASSGAGTAGGSTTVNVALFDDRNTTAYENFIRDPRAAAYVMSVVQANRRSLGIKI